MRVIIIVSLALMLLLTLMFTNFKYYSDFVDDLPKQMIDSYASSIPLFPFLPGPGEIPGSDETNSSTGFLPWGDQNNLQLTKIGNESSSPVYRLEGSTGNQSAGFYMPDLMYKGKNLTFSLGDLDNVPVNSRMVISFNVEGANQDHRLVTVAGAPLVNGNKQIEGRIGNDYYQNINASYSVMFNFDNFARLFEDEFVSLNGITIAVLKESTIGPIEVGIGMSGGPTTKIQ